MFRVCVAPRRLNGVILFPNKTSNALILKYHVGNPRLHQEIFRRKWYFGKSHTSRYFSSGVSREEQLQKRVQELTEEVERLQKQVQQLQELARQHESDVVATQDHAEETEKQVHLDIVSLLMDTIAAIYMEEAVQIASMDTGDPSRSQYR